MTEHPIARDNVIDNEYRYTAFDSIYLLTVIESAIMNTIVDVIMPGMTVRERERERERRGEVHCTEWPIATERSYKMISEKLIWRSIKS